MTGQIKKNITDLVVDRLSGWRWSQRLVDPCSGVESHGLRRFALGPEALWKYSLLIIEVLQDKHTQRHSKSHTPQVGLFYDMTSVLHFYLVKDLRFHFNVHTACCETTVKKNVFVKHTVWINLKCKETTSRCFLVSFHLQTASQIIFTHHRHLLRQLHTGTGAGVVMQFHKSGCIIAKTAVWCMVGEIWRNTGMGGACLT